VQNLKQGASPNGLKKPFGRARHQSLQNAEGQATLKGLPKAHERMGSMLKWSACSRRLMIRVTGVETGRMHEARVWKP